MLPTDIQIRFWRKVEKTDTCWNWLGSINHNGYGRFSHRRGSTIAAHKFSYQQDKGDVPPGLQLDHLCRNRKCVNPSHLEAVTPLENIKRGTGFTSKTVCPKGHPYTPIPAKRQNGAKRICVICKYALDKKWKDAHREQMRKWNKQYMRQRAAAQHA